MRPSKDVIKQRILEYNMKTTTGSSRMTHRTRRLLLWMFVIIVLNMSIYYIPIPTCQYYTQPIVVSSFQIGYNKRNILQFEGFLMMQERTGIQQRLRNKKQAVSLSQPAIQKMKRIKGSLSTSTSTSLQVFERMSEECIEILVLAQEQTNSYDNCNVVDTNMIFTGCCYLASSSSSSVTKNSSTKNNAKMSPSLMAIQKTLQRYNISKRRIETIMNTIYVPKSTLSTSKTDNEQSWLATLNTFTASRSTSSSSSSSSSSSINNDSTNTNKPFAPSTKYAFTRAQQLANYYNNPMIECHYLLLALLDYQPSKSTNTDNTIRTDPSATESNEVWNTIMRVTSSSNDDNNNNIIKPIEKWNTIIGKKDDTITSNDNDESLSPIVANVTALDICTTCIMYYDQEVTRRKNIKKELVLTGGSSTKDNKGSGGSILNDIGIDLTQMAADQLLDTVHGRYVEIQSCLRTLLRRRKNNVILLGNAGVGKTAIVEGLAQLFINRNTCPPSLYNSRIISIEISNILANTKYRGEFEEKLQNIISEVTADSTAAATTGASQQQKPRTILFFDEIHTIMGTGNAGGGEGGSIDAANILKPALARGTVQLIGATTIEEYRQSIEKDVAFARRLQPIYITEPNITQCISIIENCISYYEEYHNVRYTKAAISAAVELSERYINDRFLPDKAIDLIDEAGAMIQLQQSYVNDPWAIVDNNDDDNMSNNQPVQIVTEEIMMQLISEWSGIPLGKIELSEQEKLLSIESILSSRVIGQIRPIISVSRAIRRARSGLHDPKRPIASFLFCGPTGVGKTELCKSLAEVYYGNEKDMIRIDMSEYQDRYTVSRLTGPPPGYVGYEAGGQLTEAVRRNSHSLILFDEIEKGHEDVLNVLLQILEDGILTDGKGRTVNFKNTIIVMTSNVGSRRILDLCRTNAGGASNNNFDNPSSSGLDAIRNGIKESLSTSSSSDNDDDNREHHLYPQLIEVVKEELENTMKPELLNRIDEIVVFSPLSYDHLIQIAKLNVGRIVQRVYDEHNITISVSDDVIEQIVDEGSSNADQFGARPMRRATQRYIEDSISDAYIQSFLKKNDCATLSMAEVSDDTNKDRVIVTKAMSHDNYPETLIVEIVDGRGGIGSTVKNGRINSRIVDDDTLVNGGDTTNTVASERKISPSPSK